MSLLAAGTVVITGPKVLDIFAGFCAHRATCLKADGKDITDLKLILNADSCAEIEAGPEKIELGQSADRNPMWSKVVSRSGLQFGEVLYRGFRIVARNNPF